MKTREYDTHARVSGPHDNGAGSRFTFHPVNMVRLSSLPSSERVQGNPASNFVTWRTTGELRTARTSPRD
jgi:hypothetical protein